MKNLKTWNLWRKVNTNSIFHKILVFLEIVESPTYELFEVEEKAAKGDSND